MAESKQTDQDREKVGIRAFRNRVELILAIGVLFALYVAVGAVLCLFRFEPEIMDWEGVARSLPVCAVVAALFLSVGAGLFRTREWSRKAGMVLCWVSAAAFGAGAVYVAIGGCWLVLQRVPWGGFPIPRWPLIAALWAAVVIGLLCAYAMAEKGLYLRSDEAKALCREG